MIPIVINFFFGILTLHYFHELPILKEIGLIALIYMTVIFIFLMLLPRWKKQIYQFSIAYALGFFWALCHQKAVIDQWIPSSAEGQPVEVIGIIHQIPEQQDEILRFEFKINN